jgi:hypothetical protein
MSPREELSQPSAETGKKPEAFGADRYFPPVLREVFADTLPSYDDCPETIDCRGTPFGETIRNFREEVAEMTVDRVISVKDREERDREWDVEYAQSLYDCEGAVVEGKIWEGEPRSAPACQDHPGEPSTRSRKVFIHSHPSDNSLSASDFRIVFASLDAGKFWGSRSHNAYPPLRAMVAATDSGSFLTFPTDETEVPTYGQAVEEGLVMGDQKSHNRHRTAFAKIWEDLKGRYDTWHLKGTKLKEIEAISLEFSLRLCRKRGLPLYFMPKGEKSFHKIERLEDYFPNLKKRQ